MVAEAKDVMVHLHLLLDRNIYICRIKWARQRWSETKVVWECKVVSDIDIKWVSDVKGLSDLKVVRP